MNDPEHKTPAEAIAANADLPLLTGRQVADYLAVGPVTVHRLTRKGELKAIKFNPRSFRYRPSEIFRFVQAARTNSP